MASPPSSPSPDAEAPPPPPSPSIIIDGAFSDTIPAAEAFAVHYPGYPSSPASAAQTLAIAKVRGSDPGARLELRFRPEDPYCHPTFGEPRISTGLVLRLSRPKGGTAPPRAEVVARVRNAHHFEGMTDFQHVVPVHAAEMRKKKTFSVQIIKKICAVVAYLLILYFEMQCLTVIFLIVYFLSWMTDSEDVMMLVPPLFSIKDKPTKIA